MHKQIVGLLAATLASAAWFLCSAAPEPEPAPPFAAWWELATTNILLGQRVQVLTIVSNATDQVQEWNPGIPGHWKWGSARVTAFENKEGRRTPVLPPIDDDKPPPRDPDEPFWARGFPPKKIDPSCTLTNRFELLFLPETIGTEKLRLRFPEPGVYAVRRRMPWRSWETPPSPPPFRQIGEEVQYINVQEPTAEEKGAWKIYSEPEMLAFIEGSKLHKMRFVPRRGQDLILPGAPVIDRVQTLRKLYSQSRYTAWASEELAGYVKDARRGLGVRPPKNAWERVVKELEDRHYDIEGTGEKFVQQGRKEMDQIDFKEEEEWTDKHPGEPFPEELEEREAQRLRAFVLKYGKPLEGKALEQWLQERREKPRPWDMPESYKEADRLLQELEKMLGLAVPGQP